MKKVGIVGAGLGGLTAGVLLSKKGYKVEVFEREGLVGGRALTLDGSSLSLDEYKNILRDFDMWLPHSEPDISEIFDKGLLNSYKLDLGFHLLGFPDKSPLIDILKENGVSVRVNASKFALITPDERIYQDFNEFINLSNKLKMMPLVIKFYLVQKFLTSRMEKVPMSDTLDKHTKGDIKDAVGATARYISTVNDLDIISTAEIMRVMKQWGAGGAKATGFPEQGSITLCNGLVKVIKKNGGRVHLNTKVEKVVIRRGRAVGVVVDGKTIPFDIVISNLPVQDTFDIAPPEHFPKEYVKKLTDLEGTGSVCAYYGLSDLPPDLKRKPFAFLDNKVKVDGGDAAGIIDFQTARPEMKMSPKGQYLVQAYIICTPKEAVDRKKVEMLIDSMDRHLELLIPDYRDKLLFAIYPSIYHLDGVAKTIYCDKPTSDTPIKNFYLVGDSIKAPGIGMNCAVSSGLELAERL
ncbi:MAG: FAD-dependent oxidoreductase [Thermoplasmata archaeon]